MQLIRNNRDLLHGRALSSCRVSLIVLSMALASGVASVTAAPQSDWSKPFALLDREIAPGSVSKFPFIPDRTFEASYVNMPVFVARGASPGPTLCVTAGIHGDELNGVEVARRTFAEIDPGRLHGTVIVLPTLNATGVRSGDRYLSDRRDLNRSFPGSAGGSAASVIAHAVFSRVLGHCEALVDLHTGSNQRSNLPQVRADLSDPAIRELAVHFGVGIVVGGAGPDGSLRREVAKTGVPAIIYEAGEPLRFEEAEIQRGLQGLQNVMAYLDMTERADRVTPDNRIYLRSRWIRVANGRGGFFFPTAKLGTIVHAGELLGKVVDPFTDEAFDVLAPTDGEVIGMANPQPVLSGYGLFNLAWHKSD